MINDKWGTPTVNPPSSLLIDFLTKPNVFSQLPYSFSELPYFFSELPYFLNNMASEKKNMATQNDYVASEQFRGAFFLGEVAVGEKLDTVWGKGEGKKKGGTPRGVSPF